MKLLVTGGAGFIGSYFVLYILKKYPSYEVVNLDALTYAGNLENIKQALDNPRHKFVHGRIEDGKLVEKIIKGVEVVVNFAAESHVSRSIVQPQVFIQTNVLGTQVLLDAARKHNVKLFFQISTDEVYGDTEVSSREKFKENFTLHPNSPYSASKAAAELLAQAYYRTYDLPIIISRCSNNYGPRQYHEKFIPTVILNALQDKAIPIYGDGRYVRDWIHVLDHCHAIDLIMHHGKIGNIYNICGDNEWLNIELAKKILKIMCKDESLIQFTKDLPGHDRRYAMDSTKIKKELGWSTQIPFDSGLRQTIESYAARLTR